MLCWYSSTICFTIRRVRPIPYPIKVKKEYIKELKYKDKKIHRKKNIKGFILWATHIPRTNLLSKKAATYHLTSDEVLLLFVLEGFSGNKLIMGCPAAEISSDQLSVREFGSERLTTLPFNPSMKVDQECGIHCIGSIGRRWCLHCSGSILLIHFSFSVSWTQQQNGGVER